MDGWLTAELWSTLAVRSHPPKRARPDRTRRKFGLKVGDYRMQISHYHALLIGYAVALIGWLLADRVFPTLWPRREPASFNRPWFEVLWSIISVIGVLLVGQLYTRGWLLPDLGSFETLIEVCNQILIFSPILILLAIRRHPLSSAWLPMDKMWARLAIGLTLALIAILAFTIAHTGSDSWLMVVPRVYHPKNLGLLVQVLLEDITIAVLFVRFRAVLGLRATIALVAVLFAAGHIPTLLTRGATISELSSLILDAGLGIAILSVVQRSADIWWFWCVHFAMDMMQFYVVT